MYLPIVMLGYAGVLCLVLAGCWLVSQAIPALRGVRELSLAAASAVASVVLVGLRPWESALLSVVAGNALLFLYFLLVYWAVARILTLPARALGWLSGLAAASLLPLAFFTWADPDIVVRIILGGGVASVIAVATAVLLFRQPQPELRSAAATLGCVQLFSAAVYSARSVVSVLHPPVHFVSGDWIQTAFTYGQMLARLGTCFGVLWLAVCVHKQELENLAACDSLTGLLNRRAFDALLHREMARCRRSGKKLALILVDIDRFKKVNDTYGHMGGDEVLCQVAETLQNGMRPGDALARYGGEEFAILLREGTEQSMAIAERLRADIERSVVGAQNIRVTASFGVAASHGAEPALELLKRCDSALYRSKRQGRNRLSASQT